MRSRIMTWIREYALLTFASAVMSVGIYFFEFLNGFTTGGVSGIGTILGKITPISAGAWIWILNAVLLVLGFVFLGRQTGLKTVYCSMLYSAITVVLEKILPIQEPLTDQPFLELTYAMLLTSIGAAMIFYNDASSGGTDIVALILQKYVSIDVGKALLAVDFFVAASAFVVFNVQAGLFSLLGLFAKAFIVDGVIESFNACKYFIVITSKREEISTYIMENLGHGVTVNSVVGEFTKEEKTMIHTVCKRMEAIKLRNRVRQIDPNSFIIITTSSEIIGRGFRGV